MLKTYQAKLDDSGLDDTIRILLFRAVFNISDTHFKNIVWSEKLQKVVSVDETGERKHDLLDLEWTKSPIVWSLFWQAMTGTKKKMKCMSEETKLRLESRIKETERLLLSMLGEWHDGLKSDAFLERLRCLRISGILKALGVHRPVDR